MKRHRLHIQPDVCPVCLSQALPYEIVCRTCGHRLPITE